jgi:hypothetical protein
MADHLERIKGSLSEIRTQVAAAQDLETQSPIRSMLDAMAREVERIEASLQAIYDDSFVATADDPLPDEDDNLP